MDRSEKYHVAIPEHLISVFLGRLSMVLPYRSMEPEPGEKYPFFMDCRLVPGYENKVVVFLPRHIGSPMFWDNPQRFTYQSESFEKVIKYKIV